MVNDRAPRAPTAARQRVGEKSFTLIETVIALSIMAFLIIEVATVQGNAIVFSDYGRNVTQATWLARRVMSQIEYYWATKEFGDLDQKIDEVPFEEAKLEGAKDYKYSIEIKEWKLPFVKILTGAIGGDGEDSEATSDEDSAGGNSMSQLMETVTKQVFGDEPKFMTAHVKVCWAEGAQQNCTSITELLTNQAKVDLAVAQFKGAYDKLKKPKKAKTPKKRKLSTDKPKDGSSDKDKEPEG